MIEFFRKWIKRFGENGHC